MAEMTLYPDAHPEISSVDGYVEHDCGIAGPFKTWEELIAAGGTLADDDGSETIDWALAYFYSGAAPSTLFRGLMRGILLYDLSSFISNDILLSATLAVYGTGKTDGFGVTPSTNLYSSNPAANISLVAGDYDAVGTTPLATEISYANWLTNDWNVWTLNSAGIALLNAAKGNIAKFSVRNANYDVAGITPTWSGNKSSGVYWYQADKGVNYAPKLTITYTPSTNRLNTIKDIPTLEAIRNVQMSAMGRFYVNQEGKPTYESRYARNP